MPITKTAKRALRGSQRKQIVNTLIKKELDVAIRLAKKSKTKENISKAISKADRAVKKKVIHKNKAARIKKALNLLIKTPKNKSPKKTS